MNAPRLIIVDDSDLMRQAIELVLNTDCNIVASISDGEAAIAAAAKHTPDLVLLDISMPGLNGLEVGTRIKQALPATLLIFVSEHEETSYVDAAFRAGALGYVHKNKVATDLLPAIHSVLNGKEVGRLNI